MPTDKSATLSRLWWDRKWVGRAAWVTYSALPVCVPGSWTRPGCGLWRGGLPIWTRLLGWRPPGDGRTTACCSAEVIPPRAACARCFPAGSPAWLTIRRWTFIPTREKDNRSRFTFFRQQLSLTSGGGSSINHSLFTEVFKDFPTGAYLTRSPSPLTPEQLQGAMTRRKISRLFVTETFASWELHPTSAWYLTAPAKCWMTNVRSASEEVMKNGLSWCSCFNLSNRVLSVAWGSLKIPEKRNKPNASLTLNSRCTVIQWPTRRVYECLIMLKALLFLV